ncbi:hypothetical protein GRF59_14485 [Paenibacillus sp. HJL G12]|uniref:Uncharacterized protein n=2 Tax=Paenibacillus dendrobii TaxID=2691084 RepID=A0A7X3LI26_9BACL|nr:hypothetical protein [Paenibacillus dendrobii]
MNLYKIMFEHYSQKDSKVGTITHLVARSDEEVYEWLKNEPRLSDGSVIYNSYKYSEEDDETFEIYDADYNVIGTESFKERMIRLHGEMFDEDKELNDLYYGLTLYGWQKVKEDILPEAVDTMKSNGIIISEVGGL